MAACFPCAIHLRTADLRLLGSLVPNDQNLTMRLHCILNYQLQTIISIFLRPFIYQKPIELEENLNIHHAFNVLFPVNF